MRFIIIVLLIMDALLFSNIGFAKAELDSVDSLKNLVDNIINELSYALKINKQLMQERTELKNKIEELTSAKQTLEQSLSELKEKESSLSELEKDIKEYQAKITESNTKIIELEQKLETVQKEKEKLEESESALEETLRIHQAKITESDNKIKSLEQQLESDQKEKEKLKASQEAEIVELKANLISKDRNLENYKVVLAQADNKIEKSANKLETQKKELFNSFYKAGKAYTQAKRYKEALESFKECLKIDPNYADVHYNLGVLYQYEYGDRVSAIYHLKKYLQLNPKAKDRKEIEFLLGLLEK